jgi:hypothetical protein
MKEIVEKIPAVMIERPKMPRSTWEALRAHIIRERLKKKQELEQSQEVSSKVFLSIQMQLNNFHCTISFVLVDVSKPTVRLNA